MKMKLAGHTMATPEFDVFEALTFFHELGLDGAEIVIQSGYKSGIPYEADDAFVRSVRDHADRLGLAVAASTPYLNRYNDLDEDVRLAEVAALKRVIDMTAILGGSSIRIYGGAFKDEETDPEGKKLEQLVKSLRECGDYADGFGINVEAEDADVLSAALLELAGNPEWRADMGAIARRIAEEQFDQPTAYQAIVELIRELTA